MIILGIETSCDETAVALVEDGVLVRANIVASQIRLHAAFGGVVPELASRAHIQRLLPMIDAMLAEQHLVFADIDALAVTLGPGLVGALLIGVETAKALAWSFNKPLIPVHHIAAHLYSPFLTATDDSYQLIVLEPSAEDADAAPRVVPKSSVSLPAAEPDRAHASPGAPLAWPYIGLVVSGGHSSLVRVDSPTEYEILGETADDAAGEAFDKIAKLLELGYPGGPLVERTARSGNPARFAFPRPMLTSRNLDFSFSGLKTATAKLIRDLGGAGAIKSDPQLLADICASFQEAVVEVLLKKAGVALETLSGNDIPQLAIVGGVACNGRLRSGVADYLPGVRAVFPSPALCTDNAAMIAGLAYHYRDLHRGHDLTLNAAADLPLVAAR